jgi:magnesium chelatase subunit I
MKKERETFPFTAIQGQDEMKLGLLLNVVEPEIKGLLVFGDRGTGKSTTIRALIDLMPEIDAIKGDPFNTAPKTDTNADSVISIKTPMVDLPLGATEDRLCGSINMQKAMSDGVKYFEPGLLANANRGILYVDEVNLLDDHLIDILLDSAASGINVVEREGVSVRHEAKFILVGSGNPEEGEVRPQLLDRFGLYSEIKSIKNPTIRVKMVEARIKFDQNPQEWLKQYEQNQIEVKNQITTAQNLLPSVTINEDLRLKISTLCSELKIDGLRGDLVVNRCSKAYAALQGKSEVDTDHIQKIINLCLSHRLRKDPLDLLGPSAQIEEKFAEIF